MSDSSSSTVTDGDSLNIARYRRVLWQSRRNLTIALAVGAALAMLVLRIIPYQYTATVVVRPPDTTASSSLSSALSSLSGMAGIGGILGSADSSDYDTYNQLLDSATLSDYIAKEHSDLLPNMFATHWDATNKKWTNDGFLNTLKSFVKALFGLQPWQPPNGEDVRQYLEKEVSISNDYKTDFTTISYTAQDPAYAKNLITAMYLGSDLIVREQARKRAIKRIAYLEKLLPTVVQTDEHAALIQLLLASEETLMTVKADATYAMTPIDPPIVSARPSWPPNVLIVIGAGILAAILEYIRLLYFPGFAPIRWLRRLRSAPQGGAMATQSSRAA